MGFFNPPLARAELRNTVLYILGLMCYKLALDSVLHSFDKAISARVFPDKNHGPVYWAATLSFNVTMQCLGSLMVSPLIYRFGIQHVLAIAIVIFGLMIAIFPIVVGVGYDNNRSDAAENQSSLVPLLICLYGAAGFCQGVVELVRRVIPQRIVGADGERLKSLDSTVHIFYEVAGVTGAITSSYIIKSDQKATNLNGMYLFPALAVPAALLWSCLRIPCGAHVKGPTPLPNQVQVAATSAATPVAASSSIRGGRSIGAEIVDVFRAFGHSVRSGFTIVARNRSLIWLVPAYSLPLLLHRYLEGILLKQYAVQKHQNEDLRLVFVGGSNFGELCGALAVLLLIRKVPSPLPWLRLDAITLFLTWALDAIPNFSQERLASGNEAAVVAGVFFLCAAISFGFASGDVSLAAYIQSRLAGVDGGATRTSPLGSVMAFLYVCYIGLFAATSIPINYLASRATGVDKVDFLDKIFKWSCGIYSVCAFIVFSATFIPRGSFGFNPILPFDEKMNFPSTMKPLPKPDDGCSPAPTVAVEATAITSTTEEDPAPEIQFHSNEKDNNSDHDRDK